MPHHLIIIFSKYYHILKILVVIFTFSSEKKMGLSCGGKGFLPLLLAATLLAVGQARTLVVGGSEGWRFGVNYTGWAIQNAPFYINDKLGLCI